LIMAVDTRTMEKILTQVVLGVLKEDSPFPLNDEESILWDQLDAEVTAIDGIVEIPDTEVPDVEIPNPVTAKKSPELIPNPHLPAGKE